MLDEKFQLITHLLCPYVQRSIIVLSEKNIPYERIEIDLGNPPPWFNAISPLQKVPLLRINEKTVLFESAIICEYLNEITPGSLHPEDPLGKAIHRSWIEFGSNILDNIGGLYCAKDEETFEHKRKDIKQMFQQIEDKLTDGPYFAGQDFHLIDAVYGPIFRYFDVIETCVDLKLFTELYKIQNWRLNLKKRKSVKNAVTSQYAELLTEFIQQRKSYLSTLM